MSGLRVLHTNVDKLNKLMEIGDTFVPISTHYQQNSNFLKLSFENKYIPGPKLYSELSLFNFRFLLLLVFYKNILLAIN